MTDQTIQIPRETRSGLATLGVVAAAAGFGLVPFFARSLTEAGMAPHAVAFFRYVLAAVLFLPVLWRTRREWRVLGWGALAGAMMGLGWIGYVRALELAPVGAVGVLYMTYPVFTLAIAWLLFGDRPARRAVLAAAMILLAAVLASASFALGQGAAGALLMSLAAPLGFGFGISVLVHRLSRVAPLARIGAVSCGSVVGLAPLMLSTDPAAILPATPEGWGLVVGIALATALVPQLIYTVCSPMIGAARTAMAGAIELPMMMLVGWIGFGEALGPMQGLACLLVVAAIALTPSKVTRNVSTTIARQP